jgi:hypothetical protein
MQRAQRAAIADRLREAGPALPGGLDADRGDPARGAGDGAGLEVDLEVALVDAALAARRLGRRRKHLDPVLGELGSDRAGAVGGVAEQALRAARLGLRADQRLGLRSVRLVGRRHLDGGDQRLVRVGRGGVQLEAVEALVAGLAPVAHPRVVHRQDAVGGFLTGNADPLMEDLRCASPIGTLGVPTPPPTLIYALIRRRALRLRLAAKRQKPRRSGVFCE